MIIVYDKKYDSTLIILYPPGGPGGPSKIPAGTSFPLTVVTPLSPLDPFKPWEKQQNMSDFFQKNLQSYLEARARDLTFISFKYKKAFLIWASYNRKLLDLSKRMPRNSTYFVVILNKSLMQYTFDFKYHCNNEFSKFEIGVKFSSNCKGILEARWKQQNAGSSYS